MAGPGHSVWLDCAPIGICQPAQARGVRNLTSADPPTLDRCQRGGATQPGGSRHSPQVSRQGRDGQTMSRIWRQSLMVLLLVCSLPAAAHEMSLAELGLRETAPGEFQWQWGLTERRAPAEVLKPIWPEGCVAEDFIVRCASGAMKGPLTIEGVGQTYSAVLLKIQWADGQDSTYTLTGAKPTVQLFGSARDQRGFAEIASVYLRLGVEHILSGYDHLLFVCSLLFLVGFTRKLVLTLTAFTLAHSITLALSALDILTLRPPPVEANIALSIMLVAGEALHSRETLARRWPALIAFLFGLVHGL